MLAFNDLPSGIQLPKVTRSTTGKGIHLFPHKLPKKDIDTRTLCFVIGWIFLSMIFFVLYAIS